MDILTYAEKIEKLKAIFGQWPPPGTPWCLQVGGGRCGQMQPSQRYLRLIMEKKCLTLSIGAVGRQTHIKINISITMYISFITQIP